MIPARSRSHRLRFGLTLAALALAAPALAVESPSKAGPNADAYEALGRLVVMHQGRRKPFDTVARQEVKAITGLQSFEPVGPDGEEGPEWGPVAALFSWMNAPDYWDDQRFILAEYIPLRQQILDGTIRARLAAIADGKDAPADLKERIAALRKQDLISADDLKGLAVHPTLGDEDQDALESLAHRIDGHEKFLSPRELEEAELTIAGKRVSFDQWYMDVAMRSRPNAAGKPAELTALEKKVGEVHSRLLRYQSLRGDEGSMMMGMGDASVDRAIPRPANETYLETMAEARRKYDELVAAKEKDEGLDLPRVDRVRRDRRQINVIHMETGQGRDFTSDQFVMALESLGFNPVERDALSTLVEFYSELQADDRKVPGTDEEMDAALLTWLAEDADWAPVELVLDGDVDQLVSAGYDRDDLVAFREAYTAATEAEAEEPGTLTGSRATAVVATARALAGDVNRYPSVAEVGREVFYNEFSPFYKAPVLYGLAFALLGVSLMLGPFKDGAAKVVRGGLYGLGMLGLVGGIAMEVYGFALRIMISGWAPVTNMYETVIWVALVTSVIGLVLEAIYRRGYSAMAASGVAMLCTIVAANAQSVLNPNIEALQPVLRSNYWLTIHVITIVSSYAAFALALGLGLIGTGFYLTATYRRDVDLGRIARPLLAVPVLAGLGWLAITASYRGIGGGSTELVTLWGMSLTAGNALFFGGWALAAAGIAVTVMVVTAALGELIARVTFRLNYEATAVATADRDTVASEPAADANAASEAGGGTATIARPSVAEIKARIAAGGGPGEDSPRERAMRARAEQIKPVASFVYRALQVGVLLVAAGTILGGVWADYSWGRFWGWDPKEVSALITLLIYLIPLHGRFAGWINSFGLVCASVLCFNSVLMAWYGVNFLLGVGLHSYGFAEGGNQGRVLLTALVVSSISFGAIWRRSLAKAPSPTAAA